MNILKPYNENIKLPNAILVDDNYLENCMKIIRGYCAKHMGCDGCKFDGEYGCFLMDASIPPCDWTMPWESEVEG